MSENLESIIWEHSKTFYFATQFLPNKTKKAIWALYAFCRLTDDLIDCNAQASLMTIEAWRNDFNLPEPKNEVLKTFRQVMNEYQIPEKYAQELIDGCARDLKQSRYKNFADLSSYCYQVASTVGLMSAYIIGFKGDMQTYAIKAGIALQLTNILRDVGEDLARGRLYLPLEDFELCNCNPNQSHHWLGSEEFNKLMALQISRARNLYAEGQKGLKFLNWPGRLSVAIALKNYEEILKKIENNNYNVLQKRAYVSFYHKLSLLPQIVFSLLLRGA